MRECSLWRYTYIHIHASFIVHNNNQNIAPTVHNMARIRVLLGAFFSRKTLVLGELTYSVVGVSVLGVVWSWRKQFIFVLLQFDMDDQSQRLDVVKQSEPRKTFWKVLSCFHSCTNFSSWRTTTDNSQISRRTIELQKLLKYIFRLVQDNSIFYSTYYFYLQIDKSGTNQIITGFLDLQRNHG